MYDMGSLIESEVLPASPLVVFLYYYVGVEGGRREPWCRSGLGHQSAQLYRGEEAGAGGLVPV